MPRNYIRKRPPPNYTVEDVQNAVRDVENRNCTYREAEERYEVPISVIFHRIKGRKVPENKIGAGRNTVLSLNTEEKIVQCLIARAKMGFPCHKEELKSLIGDYIKANNIVNPFKNDIPGDDWYRGFMIRNPQVSLKRPEHLQKARMVARDPDVVYSFYNILDCLYECINVKGDISKAAFIFNADESGFGSDPTKLRAIGEKGKPLNRVSGGSGRENTTVLACVGANGTALPPLIVFKGAAVQGRWTSEEAFPGTTYGASKNGWIEEPIFFNWFMDVFIPHVQRVREQNSLLDQEAVLIFDGHASHISLRLIENAALSKIRLVKLPSHLTDRLQPLDKCVFGPLKIMWDKELVKFAKEQMGVGHGRLSKQRFSEILGLVWKDGMKPENIKKGFESTGIFPLDPSKFDRELFSPDDLRRYEQRKKVQTVRTVEQCHSHVSTLGLGLLVESDTPNMTAHEDQLPYKRITEVAVETTILDLRTRIRLQSPVKPKDIIEIFANQVRGKDLGWSEDRSKTSEKKTPTPRLKQAKYGEVLTVENIMKRLNEAEAARASQRKGKSKIENGKDKKSSTPGHKRKAAERKLEGTSESENEEGMDLADDGDSPLEVSEEESDTTEEDFFTQKGLVPNLKDWVLIRFQRKKGFCFYAGQVSELGETYAVVNFLRKGRSHFFFPSIPDTSSVDLSDIKKILPHPDVRRGHHNFKIKFPGTIEIL